MLPCPKCNYDNELGRIFCHQCGTKLDLDAIKPPSRGGKSLRKKGEGGVGRTIRWIVRLAILGALVFGLFLAFQVPSSEPTPTGSKDLESFYRKRATLENAVATRRPAEVLLAENELNAFLGTLQFEMPTERGLAVNVERLWVEFGDDTVTVSVHGKIRIGDSWAKMIAISYSGAPRLEDDRFMLVPEAAAFGKLPVPRVFLERTGLVQGYFHDIFHRLSIEQQLLDKLTAVTAEADQALLQYKPAGVAADVSQPAPVAKQKGPTPSIIQYGDDGEETAP